MSIESHRTTDPEADVDDSARAEQDDASSPAHADSTESGARADTVDDDTHSETREPSADTEDRGADTETAPAVPAEHESADGQASADPVAEQHIPAEVAAPSPSPGAHSLAKSSTPGNQPEATAPFFEDEERDRMRTEWREVQAQFVDDPRDAVTRAGTLVTDTVQQFTRLLADRKQALDSRWTDDDSADTEALRQTLRSYRSLLDQLLGEQH
ncbi:hypothetical protein [Nocardia alni]|uniref:hypothetical protein n=1 Tax=Nocardia alni TaxID=2815723 RepID=UPI001C2419D2|nr:hypothetical protein [Nocardia alni]